MKIKKKLRDLTKEEYRKNRGQICEKYDSCLTCPFGKVKCSENDFLLWQNHKDLYSDKFLDQEVEIEVPDILTKEDKEYLEAVLKPLYENSVVIKNFIKYSSRTKEFEFLECAIDSCLCNTMYFKKGTMFRNMELDKAYAFKDLGLFKKEKSKRTSKSTKKKITLTDFWNSKAELAIHCKTEEQADTLLQAFDRLGKKWSSGSSYLKDNNWGEYKEETCYTNSGSYSPYDYYRTYNYTIYEFDDVDLEN